MVRGTLVYGVIGFCACSKRCLFFCHLVIYNDWETNISRNYYIETIYLEYLSFVAKYSIRSSLDTLGLTILSAWVKCYYSIWLHSARNACHAASRTSDARSAPLNPSVPSTILSSSTFSATGLLRSVVFTMLSLSSEFGSGTKSILSKRPGRRIAGSIMSTRFVAAITYTAFRSVRPFSSVSNWLTTRSVAAFSDPRRAQRESISSKNTMHGDESLARWNSYRIAFSLSPTYLLSNSGPLTAMKFAWLSWATAFATNVFPQPGGPARRTPAAEDIPSAAYYSGLEIACTMLYFNVSLRSLSPPISSHDVSGIVVNPSRLLDGYTLSTA